VSASEFPSPDARAEHLAKMRRARLLRQAGWWVAICLLFVGLVALCGAMVRECKQQAMVVLQEVREAECLSAGRCVADWTHDEDGELVRTVRLRCEVAP
jgi:hypothetical protein